MKISELQSTLEDIKRIHGDLECVVHDGMDPSDKVISQGVGVISGYDYLWGEQDKPAAFIHG